ncbi:serine protease [Streptomyces bobili]|uniref:serine protease n=1 Tax=Streptomyces bobili TaxID=67280 RepID=UPI0034215279
MAGLRKSLVVEVLGDTGDYGTGYRVSPRLVLTAAHLLSKGARWHRVRLPGHDPQRAKLVWHGLPSTDIALLRLQGSVDGEVGPARFTDLSSATADQVEFDAIGFPSFSLRGNVREPKHVSGTIQTGSYAKSGLLDLNINTVTPRDTKEDPWRGFSGAPIVIGPGLLAAVVSRRLPAAGVGGADATDIATALADPNFRMLLEANGVPTALVTAEPPAPVVPHRRMLAGLAGLRRNLDEDHLPFVDPGDHESSPGRIIDRLAVDSDRGLLLVGAAGSGKSRTCFEVARLAENRGWRALHVLPGEPHATYDHVADAVFDDSTPVLVVIDYLNEYRGIDPATLCTRLIPEARASGITVRILASARPGWLLGEEAVEVSRVFDEIVLRTDSKHQEAVRQAILQVEAPTALATLGVERTVLLCGKRPVIAMLIARELESRVRAGMPVDDMLGIRTGDLLGWLGRRLAEDELTVPKPTSLLDVVTPRPQLRAIAAMLGSCPQPRADVEAAARAALERDQGDIATHLVEVLLEMGWLESDGDELNAVHDIVIDQVMEQVLLRPPGKRVRTETAEVVLDASLTGARTWGRFATHLGRLVRDMPDGDAAEELVDFCVAWLGRNVNRVIEVMDGDPETTGYALGAVLGGPPWGAALAERWGVLVGPWLTQYGETPAARHLLYRGLRNGDVDGLVALGIRWIELHGGRRDAQLVLGALLASPGLGEHAVQVVDLAITWLRRSLGPRAHYVLRLLVARSDLGDRLQGVLVRAEEWLRRFGADPAAGAVIAEIMRRDDLGDRRLSFARVAQTWVGAHTTHTLAPTVFGALLGRRDLGTETSSVVLGALAWLEKHLNSPTAAPVLETLLDHPSLEDRRAGVVNRALGWLDRHNNAHRAAKVLEALARHLDESRRNTLLLDAVRWLPEMSPPEAALHFADGVVNVARDDAERATVLPTVLELVRRHHTHSSAGLPIGALLRATDGAPEAMGLALDWLRARGDDYSASFLLRTLLHRIVQVPDPDKLRNMADKWLDRYRSSFAAGFVLSALLPAMPGGPTPAMVAEACRWLESHGRHPQAGYLLRVLLELDGLPGRHSGEVLDQASEWLEQHGDAFEAEWVLSRFLRHRHLEHRARLSVTLAVRWLSAHQGTEPALAIFARLAASPAAAVPDFLEFTRRWSEPTWLAPEAVFAHRALLRRNDMPVPDDAQAFDRALSWLRLHHTDPNASFLFGAMIPHGMLGPYADEVVDLELAWFREHEKSEQAGYALVRLLRVRGRQDARVRAEAREWLGRRPSPQTGAMVLSALLADADGNEPAAEAALRPLVDWLVRNPTDGRTGPLLAALLTHTGVREYGEVFQSPLVRWLTTRRADPMAGEVLAKVLVSANLGQHADKVSGMAAEWLLGHPAHPVAKSLSWALNGVTAPLGRSAGTVSRMLRRILTGLDGDVDNLVDALLNKSELGPLRQEALSSLDAWLRAGDRDAGAARIHYLVLRHNDRGPEARRFVDLGMDWLASWGTAPEAGFVLYGLLAHNDPPTRVVDISLRWIADHPTWSDIRFAELTYGGSLTTHHVLGALVARPDLDVRAPAVIGSALDHLGRNGDDYPAWRVHRALLRRDDIDDRPSVISHAFAWLERNGHLHEAGRLAAELLSPGVDVGNYQDEILDWTDLWLRRNSTGGRAGPVIAAALRHPFLSDRPAILAFAMRWLDAQGTSSSTFPVLSALLSRPDLGDALLALLARARATIDRHSSAVLEPALLYRLIVNAATSDTAAEILPAAVNWLAPRIEDPTSHVLLVSLLRSPYLGDLKPVVSQHATDYLRLHPNNQCTLEVGSALVVAEEAL